MAAEPPDPARPDTIVLIHGLWMTAAGWEPWVQRYTARGFRVLAPAWPGMDAGVEALRRDPSPIARLDVTRVADHYERLIRDLPRPPVIMGHSFGGTFVQILLDRGLGAAGVAIHPSPPRGVLLVPPSTIRSIWPVLRNPANRNRAVPLSPGQFHHAFTNTLTAEESAAIYERDHVPAAGHVLWEGVLANLNPRTAVRVDFARNDRAPLLFVAGGADHVIPAALTRANARRYARSQAVTDLKEYPGRPHHTVGVPGWEAVADAALDWALTHAGTRSTI